MDNETEKKNLTDYIIISLLLAAVILSFLRRLIGYAPIIDFVSISTIFTLLSVVVPFNNYIKKGTFKNSLILLFIIVRAILIGIFIASLYEILFSNNYRLKYTY